MGASGKIRSPETGKYIKGHQVWDGSDWEDGWVNNRGRFIVYRPDYPKPYPGGYALRYHVVWWMRTGEVISKGTVLHHVNYTKTDDRFENLQKMTHGEHTRLHHQVIILLVCATCKKLFRRPNRELSRKIKYCSQVCYHAAPLSEERKAGYAVAASKRRKTSA